MAWSTPGYCTLTATAWPSWVMARCTWPIEAAAIGTGSHSANTAVGLGPQLGPDHGGGQLGAHGRRRRLQLGQRAAHVLGQSLVEVAGHLAQLHQGALHLAQGLGHLLGGLQLERGVELLAALGVGEDPTGLVRGQRAAGAHAQAGQRGVAGHPAGPVDGVAAACSGAAPPTTVAAPAASAPSASRTTGRRRTSARA